MLAPNESYSSWSSCNITIPVANNGRVETWYSTPNIRGSWDIIRTCFATISLCTYSLLSLNIPPPNQSLFSRAKRRLGWMILAILAPEVVLTFAAGQWSRACHSVRDFRDSGYTKWNMRMAFFADMGGFVLQPRDGQAFPLNAKQLHWLVEEGHIEYPKTSPAEVADKSKQDLLSKAIASLQATYLVVNCMARAAQGLAITALELTTLGIVLCSLMTVAAWFHKPSDVYTPIVLSSSLTMDEITDGRSWDLTPLDFVDDNGPGWSTNVQPFMGMPVIPPERPIISIPNDRFPTNPYGWQEYAVCVATLLFTGTHLLGWSFSFPSPLEQELWHISSLTLFGVTTAFWILETIASWVRLGRWKLLHRTITRKLHRYPKESLDVTIVADSRKRKQVPVPWEFCTIAPIAFIYGLARLYQLVEALIELRSLPETAFVSPQWISIVPHI